MTGHPRPTVSDRSNAGFPAETHTIPNSKKRRVHKHGLAFFILFTPRIALFFAPLTPKNAPLLPYAALTAFVIFTVFAAFAALTGSPTSPARSSTKTMPFSSKKYTFQETVYDLICIFKAKVHTRSSVALFAESNCRLHA